MSFTWETKNELCRLPLGQACCMTAESMGALLYANRFTGEEIRIQSDNPAVRGRVGKLLGAAFGVTPDEQGGALLVRDSEAISRIFAGFGYDRKNIALQLNRALVEEDCCKSAFLRGAFLAGGYLSDPMKSYHLELVTSHYNVSRQVMALLLDMNLAPGILLRRGNHVLYYKDSAMIEDFLSAAGATGAAMTLMLSKVEKDLRNNVNRKVNCETANLGKTVDAAARQIAAIERLDAAGVLEGLSPALRQTAAIRLQNPELSLSEMLPLFDPPISKPGLNNRIRKLVELAEGLDAHPGRKQ